MNKFRKAALFFLISFAAISCTSDDVDPIDKSDDNTNNTVESLTRNVIYGKSTSQGGESANLLLDVYSPEGDTGSNRPLIILAHGGGFFDGTKEDMTDLSMYLAKSGFVVASLKYRLIDVEESPFVIQKAVIDAVHDMRAAVRFFRKNAADGNSYGIDVDNIFVGGYSAGGFMGLHTAYLNSDQEVLEIGGQPLLDYVNANGGLEGNSGNPGYSSKVHGSISLAGALAMASFIDAGEPILYSYHGTADDVVPYLRGESNESGVTTEGPGLYHPVADAEGVTNYLKTIDGGGHDAFWETNGSYEDLRNFISGNLNK